MATDDKNKNKHGHDDTAGNPPAVAAFDASRGEGLANLAARLPQFDGGDARVLPVGTKAPGLHGDLLGTVDLPSVIKDPKTGEAKPWVGVVIELIQAAPVKEGSGDKLTRRMALPGERIILTESTAFQRFSKAADHPTQVVEAMIFMEVGKTKAGQSLWNFPIVRMGRPMARLERHMIGVADLLPDEDVHPALPAHNSGASAQA